MRLSKQKIYLMSWILLGVTTLTSGNVRANEGTSACVKQLLHSIDFAELLQANPKSSDLKHEVGRLAIQAIAHEIYLKNYELIEEFSNINKGHDKKIKLFLSKNAYQIKSIFEVFTANFKVTSQVRSAAVDLLKSESAKDFPFEKSKSLKLIVEKPKLSISENLGALKRDSVHHLGQAVNSIIKWFPNLRKNKDAREDYKRNLSLILAFQAGTISLNSLIKDDPVVSKLWLLMNTVIMVSFQSDVSAGNTFANDKNTAITDYKSFVHVFSASLYGNTGYLQESLNKAKGFVAIWPLEYLIVWGMQSLNEIGDKVLVQSHALTQELVYETVSASSGSAAHFLGAFSVYLLAKWSLVDKVVFLNILPAIQAGYASELNSEFLLALEDIGDLDFGNIKDQGFFEQIETSILRKLQVDQGVSLAVQLKKSRRFLESDYKTIFRILQDKGIINSRISFTSFLNDPKRMKLKSAYTDYKTFRIKEWIARSANIGLDTSIAILLANASQ